MYEKFRARPEGHFVSKCSIPPNFLNDGRYVLGMNARSYRVKRYFQDEHALTFTVDGAGAPGMQWSEKRLGPVRPSLDWSIKER
jgi:lipopolysaccharide transport system ATP-binding protein